MNEIMIREKALVPEVGEMVVEYDSNNSGGSWWLTDDDWKNLEAAGWEVDWYRYREVGIARPDSDGRWLDALASGAKRRGLSMNDAVSEWEQITGHDSDEEGCSCCGQPHNFWESVQYPDGEVVDED